MGLFTPTAEPETILGTPWLRNHPDPLFAKHILDQHPAPLHPETGDPVWESGIRLHAAQLDIITSAARFMQLRGGVRAGKSFVSAVKVYLDYLWMTVVKGFKKLLYWFVGPDYEQCKEEMRHLDRLLTEGEIPHRFESPKQGSWSITFQDDMTEIVTKSSDDVTTIAGRAPRGIVMTEAAQQVESAWLACRMRVTETRGWVLMAGTYEGAAPWFYQKTDEWTKPNAQGISLPLPSWSNVVLYPGGRQDPEMLQAEIDFPPNVFREKFGGEPTKPSNLKMQHADERFNRAHRFPTLGVSYDPEKPVHLAIDPGATHAYAVAAIQVHGQTAWVFDTIYRHGREAGQVIDEVLARKWAANVEMAVMDVAGEQASSTGQPNATQWRQRWLEKTGHQLYVFTQRVPLTIGYEVHQRALLNCWPENDAQMTFNQDKRLTRVTNPEGPRLMIAPDAAGPLFGGLVDGIPYRGEYNIHRNPRRPDGSIPSGENPVDEDNDMIKALNYYLYWLFGTGGQARHTLPVGSSIRFEVSFAA